MANLIFVGPPGAGKATQAARLALSRKVMSISYGALVRDALRAETQLGRDARDAVESGQLVPDNVLVELVEERLTAETDNRGYVLIGIPRTIQQADMLQDMLTRIGKPVDLAIFFDLTVEVMINRLLRASPALGGNQVQKLETGYEHFKSASGDLSSFYSALGLSLRVDANLSPADVADQIEAGIIDKVQMPLD